MTIEELKDLAEILSKLKQDNLDIEINITIKSKGSREPSISWPEFKYSERPYYNPKISNFSNEKWYTNISACDCNCKNEK